jgi:poly-gamma-glutamate capsule biosynthesis protein CapA/YwtB (metallophosphatase superfamily)
VIKKKPGLWVKIKKIGHEKWFDLLKACAPVLIASIFGTYIAHHLKVLDETQAIYKESRDAANQLALNVTDSLSQRRFYAVRAAIAFQFHKNELSTYDEYDRHVKDWNDKLSSNLILIRRYFGEEKVKDLAVVIKKMNNEHQELLQARNACIDGATMPDLSEKTGVLHRLYDLDQDVSDYGDGLQAQLESGHVGVYKDRAVPPLKQPKN